MVDCRVYGFEFYQEKPYIAVFSVSQNVEKVVLMIVDDLRDGKNAEQFVDINIMIFLQINPKPVVQTGARENILILICDKITWLNGKRLGKLVKSLGFFGLEIKLKYDVLFGKNECVRIITRQTIFKHVLHTDLVENGHVFDHNSLVEKKLVQLTLTFYHRGVSSLALEDE